MIYTEGCYTVETYGQYRLAARRYVYGCTQLTMYDLSNLRFPLMWSKTFTNEQAEGAIELFNAIGYFDMPVG